MIAPRATITAFYEAFGRRDWDTVRSLLAHDFTFRGSMAAFGTPEDFVEAMKELPFEGVPERSRFIADGAQVAHAFVWKMTAPIQTDIPMCEVFEVRDGLIQSSELFYDSAAMPALA